MVNETAFVLLAGGKSDRMGVAKGLLKFQHTFWILEQLNRISKSSISDVYIGLGYNYDHYFAAIPQFETALKKSIKFQQLNIRTVLNKHPEQGSFSTLQAVLNLIPVIPDLLIAPVDVPILDSDSLNSLILEQSEVVIPNFQSKNGHPVKLSYDIWKKMKTLDLNDKDARLDFQLKKIDPSLVSVVPVKDADILKNLNTISDWKSYLQK